MLDAMELVKFGVWESLHVLGSEDVKGCHPWKSVRHRYFCCLLHLNFEGLLPRQPGLKEW